jgi:peptide-methionine (S)-S-oxide reductase
MKKLVFIPLTVFCFFTASCQNPHEKYKAEAAEKQKNIQPVEAKAENGLRKAYFASGCFWCVEPIFESVYGVVESHSGYAGGHTKNPTYEQVMTGRTGHAETVEVIYDPNKISFETLLDVYFNSQNITQVNGQGPDTGSQYRSIIFYQNKNEKEIIDRKIDAINLTLHQGEVAAQVLPFEKFWQAEDYHQNFKRNNPTNPYILNVSNPRFNNFKQKSVAPLKE